MNNDAALVDEIVRRILQQLPGVTPTSRAEPAAVSSSSVSENETSSSNASGGRLLTPPLRFEPAAVLPTRPELPVGSPTGATSGVTVSVPASSPIGSPSSAVASAVEPARTVAATPAPVIADVAISERIITAEVLENQLKGARVVRVTANALLTPSARDVVRIRRLEIVRESPDGKTAAIRRGRWLLLAAQSTAGLEGAVSAWRAAGADVEKKLAGDPADAAAQAISAICRGEAAGVLVLTAAPEWVACLANRNESIRAAAIFDAAAIARLKESLRPNVLAFDGSKRSSFELTGLLKALER